MPRVAYLTCLQYSCPKRQAVFVMEAGLQDMPQLIAFDLDATLWY